jgi:hypothetical protein
LTAISAAKADPLAARKKAPQMTELSWVRMWNIARIKLPPVVVLSALWVGDSADFRPVLLCGNAIENVRFGSKADIALGPRHVRFSPESGHRLAPR